MVIYMLSLFLNAIIEFIESSILSDFLAVSCAAVAAGVASFVFSAVEDI